MLSSVIPAEAGIQFLIIIKEIVAPERGSCSAAADRIPNKKMKKGYPSLSPAFGGKGKGEGVILDPFNRGRMARVGDTLVLSSLAKTSKNRGSGR
jgi:hypothetical protein